MIATAPDAPLDRSNDASSDPLHGALPGVSSDLLHGALAGVLSAGSTERACRSGRGR